MSLQRSWRSRAAVAMTATAPDHRRDPRLGGHLARQDRQAAQRARHRDSTRVGVTAGSDQARAGGSGSLILELPPSNAPGLPFASLTAERTRAALVRVTHRPACLFGFTAPLR